MSYIDVNLIGDAVPVPDARCVRQHDPEQIAEIAEMLKGSEAWMVPPVVLCHSTCRIVDGVARVAAHRLIGKKLVPVIFCSYQSEAGAARHRLLLNCRRRMNCGYQQLLADVGINQLS